MLTSNPHRGRQGDYAEFDDDPGWNDFMLRSYDPQICPDEGGISRFKQWDPYDEFSSGYVGMVSTSVETANLVNPTGDVVFVLLCPMLWLGQLLFNY
jgi:hypothetical protein